MASNSGPSFGNNWPEIMLVNDLNIGYSFSHKNNLFVEGSVLNNGEEKFNVKEIEVYKIEYI